MPEVGVGTIPIRPDLSDFGRTLGRGVLPHIDSAQRGIGSKFTGMFKSIAFAGAGLLATVGVGQFLKSTIEEAREAAAVARQTEAVIRSTGGAANLTAQDFENLATSLSNKTAVDDEVIQSGANLLATFTNVRNEVGEGNDVFSQATGLALDMSTAMGTDLNGAVIQVGKALNDPIKGVTALGRAGVQFTDDQKEMIAALVESGDTLGAQKIILQELETQFGGSAVAAADPMARLSVVVGNLKESIGTALLPVLETAATWLSDRLPGAMQTLGGWFSTIREAVESFITTFRTGFTEDEGTFIENIALKVRDLAQWITGTLWPAIQNIVAAVGGWKEALIIAGVAIAAFVAPIATLVAGLIYAYTNFEGFRNVVDAVVQWLTGTAWPAIQSFADLIVEKFGQLVVWVEEHWAAIEEAVGHVIVAVQTVIETFVDYVQVLWRQWGDEIANITELVWDQISLYVETAVNLIRGIIETVTALINGDWGEAWDGIKDILSTAWDFITEYIGNALQIVGQLLEGALSALRTIWNIAWDAIGAALSAAWDAITSAVSSAIGSVVDFFSALPGRILSAVGNLAGTLQAKGIELLAGFLIGITTKAAEVWAWLGDLPGQALRAVGNLARVLYNKGRELVQGFIDGVRSLIPSLNDVLGGVGDLVGGVFGAGLGQVSLAGVQSAQGVVDDLRDEGFRLARQIEQAERDVARAAAADRLVTREEELAILNARERSESAQQALREAKAGFALGTLSADELRQAELQAELAAENLEEVTAEATALGSAFNEASRTLENLRDQQERLAEQTADALKDLAEAQRDLDAARAEHQSLINTQLQAQLDAEAKRAAEALVTPEESLRILRAQQSLTDAEQRAIWARADPNMSQLAKDIIELELVTAANALAEAIRASTAVTTLLPGGPAPDFGGGEGVQSAGVNINVYDVSGNPEVTARSTVLQLRMVGAYG